MFSSGVRYNSIWKRSGPRVLILGGEKRELRLRLGVRIVCRILRVLIVLWPSRKLETD